MRSTDGQGIVLPQSWLLVFTLPRLRRSTSAPGFRGQTTLHGACQGSWGQRGGGGATSGLQFHLVVPKRWIFRLLPYFTRKSKAMDEKGTLLCSWVQSCDVIIFTSFLRLCSLEVFNFPETRGNKIWLEDLGLTDLEDQGPSSKFNYLQVFHTSIRGWKTSMSRRNPLATAGGPMPPSHHITDAPISETKADTRRSKGKCCTL